MGNPMLVPKVHVLPMVISLHSPVAPTLVAWSLIAPHYLIGLSPKALRKSRLCGDR